jgi:hypothetical protein
VLKEEIRKMSLHLAKTRYKDIAPETVKYIATLERMKEQFNYYDEIIKDAEVQKQNKPLTIKEDKTE